MGLWMSRRWSSTLIGGWKSQHLCIMARLSGHRGYTGVHHIWISDNVVIWVHPCIDKGILLRCDSSGAVLNYFLIIIFYQTYPAKKTSSKDCICSSTICINICQFLSSVYVKVSSIPIHLISFICGGIPLPKIIELRIIEFKNHLRALVYDIRIRDVWGMLSSICPTDDELFDGWIHWNSTGTYDLQWYRYFRHGDRRACEMGWF